MLGRAPLPESDVRPDMFQCYNHPSSDIVNDICINIAFFVPIGVLVGLFSSYDMLLEKPTPSLSERYYVLLGHCLPDCSSRYVSNFPNSSHAAASLMSTTSSIIHSGR